MEQPVGRSRFAWIATFAGANLALALTFGQATAGGGGGSGCAQSEQEGWDGLCHCNSTGWCTEMAGAMGDPCTSSTHTVLVDGEWVPIHHRKWDEDEQEWAMEGCGDGN